MINFGALLAELDETRSGVEGRHWLVECVRLEAERDEARRDYVRLWTGEHGSMTSDMLVCAARKWGRDVAHALFPDHELRRRIIDLLFDGLLVDGYDTVLDVDDEEEIQARICENHARLNREFPP